MISKFLGVKLAKLSWLQRLWLLAPLVMWFSYWPRIGLGQDITSNYELSLALIYLVILALVGLPNIWRSRTRLARNRAVWLVGSFVVLSVLSLVWTVNVARGFLTAGIIGALYLVFLAAQVEHKQFSKILPALVKVLLSTTVAVCALALVQMLAGVWLARSETLLCAGCAANQFGFVRPNVFAIEPQFLGSLLLAPALILVHVFLTKRHDKIIAVSLVLVSAVLVLTLSRGAIIAFGVGVIVLFVLNFNDVKLLVRSALLMLLGLVFALLFQGATAALNPRLDVTFVGAVSASVNHLSLGVIEIPVNKAPSAPVATETPVFTGYVEESTETRTSLSQLAFTTWSDNPTRMLVGVGLGGSGVAMNAMYPNRVDASEIVQNEFMEILIEYGILGLTIFVSIIAGLFYATRRNKWLWTIIAAYLVQWNFFSGYPNAIHVYLVLTALFVVCLFDAKRATN